MKADHLIVGSDSRSNDIELIQTHISWVFRTKNDVYKIKKPVNFGFLDFTTLEQRKHACEQEVALNRRLAADTYLGVVPLYRNGERLSMQSVDVNSPVDEWAVHMVRLDDRDRCDQRLKENRLRPEHMRRMAERLATFYAHALADEQVSRFGSADAISTNVRENFEQTRPTIEQYLSAHEAKALEHWQTHFVETQSHLFDERIHRKRVRDGHGDLRLEHVYIKDTGEITVIDCIEFNDRFRYADVACDLAFLSMDLVWHDSVELAEYFLARSAQVNQDYHSYRVIDFYESYRALVRAKIEAMVAAEPTLGENQRQLATQAARKHFLLALAATKPSVDKPRVYAVGGMIASGKTTLCEKLSELAGLPVIDSDRTRKHLFGKDALTSLDEGQFKDAYSSEASDRVYKEMFERAGDVLSSGRSVILEASFLTQAHRQEALALAMRFGLPFRFIECTVNEQVALDRLKRRERSRSVSDARSDLWSSFLAKYEPVRWRAPVDHRVICVEKVLQTHQVLPLLGA